MVLEDHLALLPTLQHEVADGKARLGVSGDLVDRNADAQSFTGVLGRSFKTSMNFGEVLYNLEELAGADPIRVEGALTASGVRVEAFELADERHFPDSKRIDLRRRDAQRAQGLKPGQVTSLLLADLSCLACALEHRLPVLTGNSHWCELGQHGLDVAVFDFRDASLML